MCADKVVAVLAQRATTCDDDPDCDLEAIIVFFGMLRVNTTLHRMPREVFAKLMRTFFKNIVLPMLKKANKSLLEINAILDESKEMLLLARVFYACATFDIRQAIRNSCAMAGFTFDNHPVKFGKAFILAKVLVNKQAEEQKQKDYKRLDWMPIVCAAKRFQVANSLDAEKFAFLFSNMHDTAMVEGGNLRFHAPKLDIPNWTFHVQGVYAQKDDYELFMESFNKFFVENVSGSHSSQIDELRWDFNLP